MSENIRYLVSAYGVGENLAPLVHSEESLGNKAFFRRLSIKSGDAVVTTPVISGNSFRGAWRDLAAMHLVETLGIRRVSKKAFVTLFSGGILTKGSDEAANALAHSLHTRFPSLGLLGFSMGNRMYASRVGVDFAVPLTQETMGYATAAYPDQADALPDTTVTSGQITAVTMMTRKKDEEKALLLNLQIEGSEEDTEEGEGEEDRARTQMIFYVEYVVPNTSFVHGFRTVYPVSRLEFGALLKILELSSERSYGGQGSRGFGRMNWRYTLTWRTSLDDPSPQRGKVSLGQGLCFDEDLAVFKSEYEAHVNGLAEVIRDDPNLSPIIQFGPDTGEDGEE
jgi:hypothetical protein